MSENTENLVLELLRAIRGDIASIKDDVRELTHRVGRVELAVAGLRRDIAHFEEATADQSVRLDRISERVDRIEKRLELAAN